jgi:membrane associated rhomboid family serine protease
MPNPFAIAATFAALYLVGSFAECVLLPDFSDWLAVPALIGAAVLAVLLAREVWRNG